jgi:hypothetical protein
MASISPDEYELTISFVVSEEETPESVTEFIKALPVGRRMLNAGDNEEGPFLLGTVTDVKITRRPA